jgi:hypothetical protein
MPLRVKPNFPNKIRLFLPVQTLSKKYSAFPKAQIALHLRQPVPLEGRIMIVIYAGRNAVDAAAPGEARDGRAGFP